MTVSRPTVRIVALGLIAASAACTSSTGSDDPTSSSAPPVSTSASSSVTATPTGSAPATSAPATGLATVDGSYVLAGASADTAALYRVTKGRVAKATTATGITSVAVDDDAVVVGRESADAELVQQLRDGKLVDLGIRSGFGPAVAGDGSLAWAALGASTTPGISKPGGSVVRVRPSLTGADRVVATFPASVSAPVWAGDDLVLAVADGDDGTTARIVRFPNGRGPARTVARVTDADELDITGGADAITVATDSGSVVVTLRDGRTTRFATGWQPLCWTDDHTVLAARGGQLGSVPVGSGGSSGPPVVLGRLPDGVRAFGGACGD